MMSPDSKSSATIAKNHRGFTLIELMIAVAVIAILAAVAYPSYQDFIRKGRRSDAITEIARVQQAQEKFRANNASYSADLSSSSAGLGIVSGTTATASYTSPLGYYTISIPSTPAVSGTAYAVVAIAVSGKSQVGDTNCQCLRVVWSGADASYDAAPLSGGSCGTFSANNASACWRQ
jgi:type IV pilus assembly protein PilE